VQTGTGTLIGEMLKTPNTFNYALREMGNELMHIWALEKESVRVKEIKKSGDITAHGKKNFIGIRHSE